MGWISKTTGFFVILVSKWINFLCILVKFGNNRMVVPTYGKNKADKGISIKGPLPFLNKELGSV